MLAYPTDNVVNGRLPGQRYVLLALLATMAMSVGCASPAVSLRKIPRNVLAHRLALLSSGGPKPTERTVQLLRRYDLSDDLRGDPHRLLGKLQAINAREPTPEIYYSMAELAYLAGNKAEISDKSLALDMYSTSVANAYQYLFDDQVSYLRNPYDPQYRGACDLYNQALEGSLRLLGRKDLLRPGCKHTVKMASHTMDITVVARSGTWRDDDFDEFEFVSDYQINGLNNHYQTFGLGVPLIAVRKKNAKRQGANERFYPPNVSFPVTAFLRLENDGASSGNHTRAVLELYDPLVSTDIIVRGRRTPLESDLSTPLAYFLNNPEFQDNELATAGLLNPGRSDAIKGLYMLEPYQPGKIPVLMVHGLWSSPLTWMQMFNDLRSDREIRDHFQFWFYLYPTGQPFWHSAAELREDLAEMRRTIDPQRRQMELDQMVLVGHSMGGLVSMLQTIDSDDRFWKTVSDTPFQLVKASDEVREELEKTVFFDANGSIRRVITIATPHRGSNFASAPARWLARHVISLPKKVTAAAAVLQGQNADLFRQDSLAGISTSIDSLSPDSPILPVMLAVPKPPWVRYHNIVGVLQGGGWKQKFAGKGDGVVLYESSHLEKVESEIAVDADHSAVHAHPRAVLEVRRILLRHLDEMRRPYSSRPYSSPLPRVRHAGHDSWSEPWQRAAP